MSNSVRANEDRKVETRNVSERLFERDRVGQGGDFKRRKTNRLAAGLLDHFRQAPRLCCGARDEHAHSRERLRDISRGHKPCRG
jgi:hypothetical protein